MTARVVEVFSITAAPGWWCTLDEGASFAPLACWALGLVVDESYKSMPADRTVVGVLSDELDSIVGLELVGRRYHHDSEFEILGEVLK